MKTITFYSYKGGVGRSLALVNIATRLAEFGKKVCIIDFDLEAPGLHLKFPLHKKNLERLDNGIVDYVYDFSNFGLINHDLKKFSIDIHVSKNGKPIILIPAGNTDSIEYWKKLSSINWYDLVYNNSNGLAFFLNLKEDIFKNFKPDFLLIDSRTGISEMSGITLSLLADEIVIVAANNKENLGGANRIIKSLSNPENNITGKKPNISFVLSRIPFTDKPEDRAKEINLINRIKREYLQPYVNEVSIVHSDRELEENERVKIAYEKDEVATQTSIDYLTLFEKLTKDDLKQNEIRRFNNIRESEKLIALANNTEDKNQKIDYASKAIELNKTNIDFYVYRASIFAKFEDFDKANADLERALKLNENYIPALNLMVRTLIDLKKFTEAESTVNHLLELRPFDISGLVQKIIIYSISQRFDEAEQTSSELIRVNPEYSVGYSCRGNVRRLKKDFENALIDVYKAIELDSQNLQAVATLAEIYAEIGKTQDFYIHFESSLRLNPEHMQKTIIEEDVYKRFYEDERFNTLLLKYGIDISI